MFGHSVIFTHMKFEANLLYHVYNRGNHRNIAHTAEEYQLLLGHMQKFISPCCDILAWCIMPTHFHLLVHCTEKSIVTQKVGGLYLQQLTNGIRQWLSSYSKAINKKYGQTGNLFQQKTKAKCLNSSQETHYAVTAFYYIHQNPLQAKLVEQASDWKYSSLHEYTGKQPATIVNKELAVALMGSEVLEDPLGIGLMQRGYDLF
jgi:REP element-mobilizing transposase RayT